VGNRTQRVVTANGNVLTTDYSYDDDDRLRQEVHDGPVWAMLINNEPVYAYADSSGGITYRNKAGTIGKVEAFVIGLPTRWSRYAFISVLALLPLMFLLPAVAEMSARFRRSRQKRSSMRLSLFRRCLSVLLAYMILLSPCGLQSAARGATLYSQLDTRHWSEGDRTITYEYDDNGSVTGKVIDDGNDTETFSYVYNLQNRLVKVTQTFSDSNEAEITEYKYDPQGIRVSKHTWSEVSGTPQNDDVTVVYLVDSYNPTGYTQVLEELVFNKANPDPSTETPDSTTTYTIGDDVIAQDVDGTSKYLLYDGHGSTRQLAVRYFSADVL